MEEVMRTTLVIPDPVYERVRKGDQICEVVDLYAAATLARHVTPSSGFVQVPPPAGVCRKGDRLFRVVMSRYANPVKVAQRVRRMFRERQLSHS